MMFINSVLGALNATYIKVEVKGNLTENELRGLKEFLQNAADEAVMAIQSDFEPALPEDML